MPDVTALVEALLSEAVSSATTETAERRLQEAQSRFSGPLRLAIAGKVKAGKSTLLNALIGEELAATDAGECTRIVTWYRDGSPPRVLVHPLTGAVQETGFRRQSGALDIDLGPQTAASVDHVEVQWPTLRLSELTLIDTPGLQSLSTEVSARTRDALEDGDGGPPVADAVLYLLRHAHAEDVRFLEAFHTDDLGGGTPVNTVGVLSRADEIGACRLDAMATAHRISDRYQSDRRLTRVCPLVVPVAGLIAQTGSTLRQDEHRALAQLARLPVLAQESLLLSADRFLTGEAPVPAAERSLLMRRLGLFGVRLSVELIRSGAVSDCVGLSQELVRRSGLDELRWLITTQFTRRSRVLRARSALRALDGVLAAGGCRSAGRLRKGMEEIHVNAHAITEMRTLDALYTGALRVDEAIEDELQRLLGARGDSPVERLGLPPEAGQDEIDAASAEALDRWRRRYEDPLAGRPARAAAEVAVRSVQELLAS